MNHQLKLLLSKEDIEILVTDLAHRISKDYEGRTEDIVLIGLLRGSIIFLADLARKLTVHANFDFMVVSSYGNGNESSRDVRILKDLDDDIRGKIVILIEDVVDTGYTLQKIISMLKTREPKELKSCALLDKPSQREVPVTVDYSGKAIGKEFIVGYGIDFAQKYRTLPDIYEVVFEED